MSILIPATLAIGVVWILWRTFRAYILNTPFDNIPGPDRTSFWQGNLSAMYSRHGWEIHDKIATEFPSVTKYHAAFGVKGLYVSDPLALHHILVKEQDVYEEPRWFTSWNHMAFGPGLLATLGDHHRRQRKLLNPVFSIAHMRNMTPLFYNTAHRLRAAVENRVGQTTTEINVLHWMTRTALELIGQGGLGYSFDPLTEEKRNEFADSLKQWVPTNFKLQYWRMVYPRVCNWGTAAIRRAIGKRIPHAGMQRLRGIIELSDLHSRQIYNERKAALQMGDDAVKQQVGEGKDLISILLKANTEAKNGETLPEEEVIAQMSMLVLAATDTTSNAVSRILSLLAENQDIQDKVRQELDEAGPDGQDIAYDQLVDLPYLDAVCRETLRLHPPVPFLSREVRRDTILPFSEPIQGVNGEVLNEVLVPKDTSIVMGIRACNRSKAIWGSDALEWKPERWIRGLPESVSKAHVPGVYANLMTFLGGGRACIGFKFSQLEMKVVLAVMLRSFRFHPSGKEIYWNLASVSYPTVGKESTEGSLPLLLEPLHTRVVA